MNEYTFDMNLLMHVIQDKLKDLNLSLRTAAKEIGTSASTLSRIIRGNTKSIPDFQTMSNIARWLEMKVSDFEIGNRKPVSLKLQFAEVEPHLRQLAGLDAKGEEVLVAVAKAAYKSLKGK